MGLTQSSELPDIQEEKDLPNKTRVIWKAIKREPDITDEFEKLNSPKEDSKFPEAIYTQIGNKFYFASLHYDGTKALYIFDGVLSSKEDPSSMYKKLKGFDGSSIKRLSFLDTYMLQELDDWKNIYRGALKEVRSKDWWFNRIYKPSESIEIY